MPDIKIHRAVMYKIFTDDPGPCPKFGGGLEKSNQIYMVITRTGNHLEDSFVISGDFGWYCQSCPVVVLNQPELSKMMAFNKPGWKVGHEFTVVGVLNPDAIPANMRNMPLEAPGVPSPLVKFSNLEGEEPIPRHRRRKK